MKNFKNYLLIGLLGWIALVQTGCFGKFSLTRKIYDFHDGIMDNDIVGRFVKSILLLFPGLAVYGLSATIDIVILNLIEFWTGSNPLSMKAGEVETQYLAKGGIKYEITATRNQFAVKQLDGELAGRVEYMIYNEVDRSWSVKADDTEVKVLSITEENGQAMVNIYKPDGSVLTVNPLYTDALAVKKMLQTEFALAKAN